MRSLGMGFPCQLSRSSISVQLDQSAFCSNGKNPNTYLETVLREKARLTFESFALEGLGHNTCGLALHLLGLPEGFAQLLYIVAINYICVPPTKATQAITRGSCVAQKYEPKEKW